MFNTIFRNIKNMFLIIVLLIIIFCIVGCKEGKYTFINPVDEIENIEIVYFESNGNFSIVKELTDNEREDFISKLDEIDFKTYMGDPPRVYGDSVRIIYKNGDYEIICYYTSEYVNGDDIKYRRIGCSEERFKELLNQYLE